MNIRTAATHSQELSATIAGISTNTGKARHITGQVITAASKTSVEFSTLDPEAQDIGINPDRFLKSVNDSW